MRKFGSIIAATAALSILSQKSLAYDLEGYQLKVQNAIECIHDHGTQTHSSAGLYETTSLNMTDGRIASHRKDLAHSGEYPQAIILLEGCEQEGQCRVGYMDIEKDPISERDTGNYDGIGESYDFDTTYTDVANMVPYIDQILEHCDSVKLIF